MTIIPLHPDPNDDSWDTENYALVESEMMPVRVFEGQHGLWYWRVDHPAMSNNRPIGPFDTAKLAYQNLMQYEKLWESPTEMPDLTQGKIAMGAVEATLEGLPKK